MRLVAASAPIARSCCLLLCAAAMGAGGEEFKVQREELFEFAGKPVITRAGDSVTIAFESRGLCDATVAIENARGEIIRHLVSGVLGPRAPEPFQRDSKRQVVVWDGKDDQGVYVDDKEACTVRVSLGLKPRFERTLYWSPKKRIAPGNRPLFASAPEGVYVFEGGGVDHLRLFDHDGQYLRTIYPFPPDYSSATARANGPRYLQSALAGVQGLEWTEFPQDGKWLPVWNGVVQATLFTSGNNTGHEGMSKYGCAASAMALHGGRFALAMRSLNRLSTDGTTGGMALAGPRTSFPVPHPQKHGDMTDGFPRSAAFSPDGKWLYLTGYAGGGSHWLPGVVRLDYGGDKEPELFAGSMKLGAEGTDNRSFRCPMSVACDSQGRVYVADCVNDRIQVYDAGGQFVKTLAPVRKPVNIFVNPRNGHIYVASWMRVTRHYTNNDRIAPTLTHFGPLDDFKPLASHALEFAGYSDGVSFNRTGGAQHEVFVDFHAAQPVVWVVPGTGDTDNKLLQLRRSYSPSQWSSSAWSACHYRLFVEQGGKLVEKANFARDVAAAVTRIDPPSSPAKDRRRMYVHPRTGLLHVAESDGSGVGKAFRELVVIDPASGKVRLKRLPFTVEDMDFDLTGHLYLRTDLLVARFEPEHMREVPWNYGEEIERPGFDGDGPKLSSALPLPGSGRPGCFHLGGFGVSPKGHVAVSCYNVRKLDVSIPGAFSAKFQEGRPYTPSLYPGRLRWAEVHVWDKRGRLLYEDAVPGLPMTDGLAMDRDDNIYVLAAANRVLDGQEYPLERAETLMKFKARRGRIVSRNRNVPIPLPQAQEPERPVDVAKGFAGPSWAEGAEWLYGGVGYGGFMSSKGGGGCACWNARFALDLFARSFVTELNRFQVAVLDTNGNLILRLGKYGNVDDGLPLVTEGGPANPRPVGGDEVALCHASYTATHTDRRLFISDHGNYRILSVKLGYHAEERLALADAPDRSSASRP